MKIIQTVEQSAQQNMDLDQAILSSLATSADAQPVLHFYDWKGQCATYGHFINPFDHLIPDGLSQRQLDIAKRPTGGGIVFHLRDLTFSFLLPAHHPAFSLKTLDNYAYVNQIVVKAICRLMGNSVSALLLQKEETPLNESCRHFCMAHPTIYDIIIDGRKVGGAAQRRTKFGYLHQGTITLKPLPPMFLEGILRTDLVQNGLVQNSIEQHSCALFNDDKNERQLEVIRQELRHLLRAEFENSLTFI